jgi:CHAT domain-containing protein
LTLEGPAGRELRRQEEESLRKVSGLRARAQLISPEDAEQPQARELLKALDEARARYAEVWGEVLSASPVYRGLSAQDPSRTALETLRDHGLGPKTLLLAYHVGRQGGHLLLLGDRSTPPEAFALTVAAAGSPGDVVPLNQQLARELVDRYREQVQDPRFGARRGLRVAPDHSGQAVPPPAADLLGNVLLPPAARQRIRELAPDCLVVIPDGALHKLPLEALLLETDREPRFVLDELPPIVYAPSAAVLAVLAGRTCQGAGVPWSLLTVSNPDYREGSWARLPFTEKESERVRKLFAPFPVEALTGGGATERAVRRAMAGKRVIHLATHGSADEESGNLFGALALTPPPGGRPAPDDDGSLALHEIYTLPLQDCELAVLSACDTNVGPQPRLEAGVTLAGAFLAAGARRVVASHWGVNDQSTADLMAAFFAEVTSAARAGGRVSYARALQGARLKLRNTAGWEAPFYWAPFVLMGPGD